MKSLFDMRHQLLILFLLGLFQATLMGQATENERPNILFCLADDWGWPHAGAYGDAAVKTPNFDRIAREGVLFTNAYVASPSCTPSRNAFITGKYPWELGPGANLWSTLPEEHGSFIHTLEDAGYAIGRTTAKTWGPGSLENWVAQHGAHPSGEAYETFGSFLESQVADQPFFFWLGTSDPHRDYEAGSGKASGIDVSQVHLFDHYPDSEVVRNDVADYYYEVQRWDSLVGTALDALESRGLLENTIVIMTGDHGMPFPRCKGNLYDSGTRVPFAVRWGKQVAANRRVEDFISFADIAPTLLQAAGQGVPADMTGRSFAGLLASGESGWLDEENRGDIVFGRERHVPAQEKPDMRGYPSRGYRNRDFLYIRNYEPDLWPMGTGKIGATNYPGQWYADCDGGPTKDYIIANKDRDAEHRRAFELSFGKRPAEELYDLKKDPGQVHNVASDPAYTAILEGMRRQLAGNLTRLNDPRANDPDYAGFQGHPYLGGGGGTRAVPQEDE